jgi:hypothetical protein
MTGIPGEVYSDANPFYSRLAGDNRSDAFITKESIEKNEILANFIFLYFHIDR